MKNKEDYLHLIPDMKKWLGEDGLNFFLNIKREHGTVNAVWMEGNIPHPVHFREGIKVRNQLRKLTNYSWTDIEYDDTWVQIIEECIK